MCYWRLVCFHNANIKRLFKVKNSNSLCKMSSALNVCFFFFFFLLFFLSFFRLIEGRKGKTLLLSWRHTEHFVVCVYIFQHTFTRLLLNLENTSYFCRRRGNPLPGGKLNLRQNDTYFKLKVKYGLVRVLFTWKYQYQVQKKWSLASERGMTFTILAFEL